MVSKGWIVARDESYHAMGEEGYQLWTLVQWGQSIDKMHSAGVVARGFEVAKWQEELGKDQPCCC